MRRSRPGARRSQLRPASKISSDLKKLPMQKRNLAIRAFLHQCGAARRIADLFLFSIIFLAIHAPISYGQVNIPEAAYESATTGRRVNVDGDA